MELGSPSTCLDDGSLRQNLEIKARVDDVDRLMRVAAELATAVLPSERQIDTYFRCGQGRLKLREIEVAGGPCMAQLIHYERADIGEAKPSHYRIAVVSEAAALKATLQSAYGIWRTVEKHRQIFLHENVRIHIDAVIGLGTFMELEAVQAPHLNLREQELLVARLMKQLGIRENDLLRGSYSDLLSEAEPADEPAAS